MVALPNWRADVLAWAAALGIEIEEEVWKSGLSIETGSHVHAYAPEGMEFAGSGCSQAMLWSEADTRIDWARVSLALGEELPLVPAGEPVPVLKVGDRVTWVNEQGVVFPGRTIVGLDESVESRGLCFFLEPSDAPWFAVPRRNLTPEP